MLPINESRGCLNGGRFKLKMPPYYFENFITRFFMVRLLYIIILSGISLCSEVSASVSSDLNVAGSYHFQGMIPVRNNGNDVALMMNKNYHSIVTRCNEGTPAYFCSGITLRATKPTTRYNAWDPSPSSVASGGVSFSWLRKDVRFKALVFDYLNGFVLFNKDDAPKNIDHTMNYLCYFPEDAASSYRPGNGCGANTFFPKESASCQLQGITTAEKWVTHFNSISPGSYHRHQHQCGFLLQGEYNNPDTFYQAILAGNKLHGNGLLELQNEIRISTWDKSKAGYPQNFPVQDFFILILQANPQDLPAPLSGDYGGPSTINSPFIRKPVCGFRLSG